MNVEKVVCNRTDISKWETFKVHVINALFKTITKQKGEVLLLPRKNLLYTTVSIPLVFFN